MGPLLPWRSWQFVHAGFQLVYQWRTAAFPQEYLVALRAMNGLLPASPIVTFLFFGVRKEVFEEYTWIGRSILALLSGKVPRRPVPALKPDEPKITNSLVLTIS